MDVDGLTVEVVEVLPAAPDQVHAVLSDPERTAGLGPECIRASWVDESRGPGARFRGENERQGKGWEVLCTVLADEPGQRFVWAVGDPALPSSTWSYDLTPVDGGTQVVQRFVHGPGTTFLRAVVAKHPDRAQMLVAARTAELEDGMRATLRAAAALLSS